MQWPSRAEYTEAVRDYPHVSLQDTNLKGGKPRRGKDNFVISDTGAFSIVFPIDIVSRTFALRCWVKDVGNAKNRYKKISAYLKQKGLPYFVDFEYVPEGILVNGTKYPITRMEWVEGVSLREFIEQNLQTPTFFKTVATKFQKMVAVLHTHQIAHGDLQDGNILLKKNGSTVEIKLIDYDSLFVPSLRGQPEQILGLPEYQHPKRITGGGQANEKVDYFSELVIYLSFLSLAEKPELWNHFKDKTERGLLFSKEDFENPDKSNIFQELEKSSPDVRQLAATLKDFCAKTSIDQLEPLEAVLPKPDANAYTNSGFSFLNNRQYDEALAEFQKAITLNPSYEKAHYGIGLAYLHSGRYTDAINIFEQLVKGDPNYKEAYHGLGLAYFRSGDNSKATEAANAALAIDSHYQPARQLLDAIKSAMPPGPPDPITNFWQYIINTLKSNRHSVTTGTLGLALVICFIAFLTQMDAKDTAFLQNTKLTKQLAQKESEIRQKGLEIQSLTSSVQTLENQKEILSRKNGELQDQLKNRTLSKNMISKEVANLRKQLSEKETALTSWVDENQKLRSQLAKKNTELRTQVSIAQRLQNEKTDIRNENQRLQKEKTDALTGNHRLQGQNQNLIRQNQRLRDERKSLQDQLNIAKQNSSSKESGNDRFINLTVPEPPKRIDEYRDNATRACVYNNNKGITAFRLKDYDKAVIYFKQAVQADLKFAVTHYNLGCVYLEMGEYRKAISAFSDAVAVNRKFKGAYYNLGLAHLGKGAHKQAKSSIELALRIDKNYQRARNLLTAIENAQR